MIEPWKLLNRKHVGDFKIFDITVDRKANPRNGYEHDFYIMHPPGWVNIVPITTNNEFVLVEQFRHGSETVEIELPGGVMDPEDASPVETAIRELREETGYEGQNARIIGEVFSNPAIQSNKTSTVLIEDCELRHDIELDPGEDLNTKVAPFAEVERMAANGIFRHSLVVAALYHYEQERRRNGS